jgi:hypothetical protein
MELKEDVQQFLNDFKQKARTFGGIYYYPRKINTDTLLALGITSEMRKDFIMNLSATDYYKGPTKDEDPQIPDFYEFGLTIKGQEVYIKLSLGIFSKTPHCMSFHISKHPIKYPLK